MTQVKGQNWQDVQESALGVIGTSARTNNESIFSKLDLHQDFPARLFATLAPDSKLNIAASSVEAGDGAKKTVSPVQGTIVASAQGSVDYQLITGMVSGITLTLNGGAYAHPVASAAGKFVVGVFSRKKDGSYNCVYSAIQNSLAAAQAIDVGTLFVTAAALPIGYIYLTSTDSAGRWKTAGSVTSVIENKTASGSMIFRTPAAVDFDYFLTTVASLQTQIDTINNTFPLEEFYETLSAGHRTYSVSGFTFDALNTRKDIQVFRNMGRLKSPKDFAKVSTSSILLTFDPAIGDEILIDKRR